MNGRASGPTNHPTGGLTEGLSDRPTYVDKLCECVKML